MDRRRARSTRLSDRCGTGSRRDDRAGGPIRHLAHKLTWSLATLAAVTLISAPRSHAEPKPSAGDPPPCARDCLELARTGELRSGVTSKQCALDVCRREGHTLYLANRHEAGLAALDYVKEQAGEGAAYHLDRGLILYALERFDEAIAEFDQVLEKYPISIRAGTQRAFALGRLGRLDDAQEQFEYMLRWRTAQRQYRRIKTTSYLRGSIGMLKLRRGDLDGAREDLKTALDIDASNDFANMVLNKILPQMEAGHLTPDGFGHLTAAFESLDLHREVAATRHLQALVSGSPTYVPAYLVLAKGLRETSRYADCEALLASAEQKVPGDLTLRVERLRCAILRSGASSSAARPAIAEVRQILEEHPDNELARKLLTALDAR